MMQTLLTNSSAAPTAAAADKSAVLTASQDGSEGALQSDGKGGFSDSWAVRSGSVPCRLVREKDQILGDVGGVVTGPSTPILLLAVGVDFKDRDRIVVNGGVTYQAVGRISAESETTVVQRVIVREV